MIIEPLPVQFAVVREDPRIEERIARERKSRRALLIGSGGCTALHLRAALPELQIQLIDPNPAQLRHVDAKLRALAAADGSAASLAAFNVDATDEAGLSECGNFERLFRLLRDSLDRFVIPADERQSRLQTPGSNWDDVFGHRYWLAAFASVFHEDLLVAMFGPDAVQHAERGSYPRYFCSRIQRGLQADDRHQNPWLHHVLLGQYLPDAACWPPFLQAKHEDFTAFRTHECPLLDLPSFEDFDFVQLSNVMDWMDEASCVDLARRLVAELRPGATILWRQLNNNRDLAGHFAPAFAFDAERDARLTEQERSLFYNQVRCGIRQ